MITELQGDNFIRTNFVGVTAVDEGTIDGKQLTTTQGVLGGVLGAGNNQLVGFSGLLLPLPTGSPTPVARVTTTPTPSQPVPAASPTPAPSPRPPHPLPVPEAGPDLAVFSVNVQPQTTGTTRNALILFSVSNIGSVNSGVSTIVSCVIADKNQFVTIGPLAPGSSVSGVFFFPNLGRGSHTLSLTVDPVPGETNISNNRVTQTFFLSSVPSKRRIAAHRSMAD